MAGMASAPCASEWEEQLVMLREWADSVSAHGGFARWLAGRIQGPVADDWGQDAARQRKVVSRPGRVSAGNTFASIDPRNSVIRSAAVPWDRVSKDPWQPPGYAGPHQRQPSPAPSQLHEAGLVPC